MMAILSAAVAPAGGLRQMANHDEAQFLIRRVLHQKFAIQFSRRLALRLLMQLGFTEAEPMGPGFLVGSK